MIHKTDYHKYDDSKKLKDPKKQNKKKLFKQEISKIIKNGEYEDVELQSREKFHK